VILFCEKEEVRVVIRDDGVGGGVREGGVGPILATVRGTAESARLSSVKPAEEVVCSGDGGWW